MRILLSIILIIFMMSCKNDTKEQKSIVIDEERTTDSLQYKESDLDLGRERSLMIKRQELLDKKDAREKLENLIISHSFMREEEWYTMDFKYPFLNEKIDTRYQNFNEYIAKNYLDADNIEKQMREEKRLL